MNGFLPEKSKIPHKSGVYIFKDENGSILYVGKAVDLYSRVSSYFSSSWKTTKTAHLVEKIADLETIIVQSELEALILEANLIKKYLPPYNIKLTDDKDYLYIAITKEDFPKIITARKKDLKPIKKWFGPFPSATTVKTTLKKVRRVFPWCSNPPGIRNKNHRPCFYFHLNLCPGACTGIISEENYGKIISRFSKFMDNKKTELLNELNQEMSLFSKNKQFEEALKVKKTIEGIEYISQPTKIQGYLENPNFLEDLNKQALDELVNKLNLPKYPERIECYDISNFQGTDATGSMVVLTNGETDKSGYRKFKIKITGKIDDFAMHSEMMSRRTNHPEWGIPDLIIIDGGIGQVRAAKNAIDSSQKENNLFKKIPIFGLAKRMEWLYPPEGDVIKLPRNSLALRALQKIRDESHRFAVTYHKKLRKNSFGLNQKRLK